MNHIYTIPDDIFIHLLNDMLEDSSKVNLYLSSKHLARFIPHTILSTYTYNGRKQSMPNILKDKPHKITFGIKCLRILKTNYFQLPKSVKEVIYAAKENTLPNLYESNVEKLSFGYTTIKNSLYNLLPKSLKVLYLPIAFNEPLHPDDLPDTLEELHFDSCSNYYLDLIPGALPKSLKKLTIHSANSYLSPPKDVFPEGLIEITIGSNTQINEECLPSSLKVLRIYGNNNNVLLDTSILPRSLEVLTICQMKQPIVNGLPPNLKRLAFDIDDTYTMHKSLFPVSLEYIGISGWYTKPITKDTFPPNVKLLTFDSDYRYNIQSLPDKLEELWLECKNNPLPRGFFPDTLRILYFDDSYNQPILEHMLPSSLEFIHFGEEFNQSISNVLVQCTNLKQLSFGHNFNKPLLPGMLPSSLKILYLSDRYNKSFSHKSLPENLKDLSTGDSFNKPIELGILPSSLKELTLGRSYSCDLIQGSLPEELESFRVMNDNYEKQSNIVNIRLPKLLKQKSVRNQKIPVWTR
jgi:hypothetical protein